jgi:hypothetical protein
MPGAGQLNSSTHVTDDYTHAAGAASVLHRCADTRVSPTRVASSSGRPIAFSAQLRPFQSMALYTLHSLPRSGGMLLVGDSFSGVGAYRSVWRSGASVLVSEKVGPATGRKKPMLGRWRSR